MSRKPYVWSLVGALSLAFAAPSMAQSQRISANQKGSLLIFSKVEIKWDANGAIIQDTFVDVSNDADGGGVDVQAYFINGDRPLEELCTGNPCTDIIQEAEPGWNRIDCRFHLTKNEPAWFSAAKGGPKCPQGFTALDSDGPGRPDPDTGMTTRILRGYIVMWATAFNPNSNRYEEIRWNHLKGDAVIVNYTNGTAWEYNAWAAQARNVAHGGFLPTPGELSLDGSEYDSGFDKLLLDFYGTGTEALSSEDVDVALDSDLTLHAIDVDLRQDNDGPVLTKAEFEVFNQNESKLSGLRRCICCWDQEMFSNYVRVVGIPNYFLRRNLGTDKGAARIDGMASTECNFCDICGMEPPHKTAGGDYGCWRDYSKNASLLGLATKFLSFSTGDEATAGMNLVGVDYQSGVILHDLGTGTGESRTGDRDTVGRTSTSKSSDKTGTDGRDAGVRSAVETAGE